MLLLRVLGALIVAALIGFVIGMLKDYFKLFPDSGYAYVWPITCAASAFVGAFVMACMKPSRLVSGGGPPARTVPIRSAKAASGPAALPPARTALPADMATSHEVPGMPTFDFDKARGETGATAKPAGTEGPK
jgi:hypothetical protein